MCEESSMKKKFPAMAEVGMKGRPAGLGRDEFSSSHRQIPFPDPVSNSYSPPTSERISRFGKILTEVGTFLVIIASSTCVFLLIFFMRSRFLNGSWRAA